MEVAKKGGKAMSDRFAVDIQGRLKDKELPELLMKVRSIILRLNIDLQVVIYFPESPERGNWATRPYSRGGPDVIVSITGPKEKEEVVCKILAET